MHRLLLLLILLLLCTAAYSQLVMTPGTGQTPYQDDSRETHVRYHTGSDDMQFYGPDTLAVRFDFSHFYPSVPNCAFTIKKARLFFPNVGSTVSIRFFADADSLPAGNPLRSVLDVPITSTLMDISLPDSLTMSVVWLVVGYNTNATRTVSASQGGGTHSFFQNTSAPSPFWQSFLAAGFSCELRFGLLGNYVLNSPDLELVSFDFIGTIRPDTDVRPVFGIYNHSNTPIIGAQILLEFTTPSGTDPIDPMTLTITETVAAHDSLVVPAPGYGDYFLHLPRDPMQLRVKATLSSELAENASTTANNIKTKSYTVFSDPHPICLMESFHRSSTVSGITPIQDAVLTSQFHPIFYFPNAADDLYALGSYQRFNWYSANFLPTSVVHGNQRINGNPANYQSRLQDARDAALNMRTFISRSTCTITDLADSDNLDVDFTLSNDNTRLFEHTNANPALAIDSRFFAGLFKRITLAGQPRNVLIKWIAFADTVNTIMQQGSTLTKEYTFSQSNLTGDQLAADYCIYYWLQKTNGGIIHYAGQRDFSLSDFTSVVDELLPPPVFKIYPNPLRHGNILKFSTLPLGSTIRIYNLRGQLIWHSAGLQPELSLPPSVFPASGIYFIRREDANGNRTQILKLSYIK